MMDKIYLITCGEYSDYQVVGFCLTEEEAKKYCIAHNSGTDYDFYDYEECEKMIFDADFELKDCYARFKYFSRTDKLCRLEQPMLTRNTQLEEVLDMSIFKNRDDYVVIKSFPQDITEEKAKKICQDLIAKKKAEDYGL